MCVYMYVHARACQVLSDCIVLRRCLRRITFEIVVVDPHTHIHTYTHIHIHNSNNTRRLYRLVCKKKKRKREREREEYMYNSYTTSVNNKSVQ